MQKALNLLERALSIYLKGLNGSKAPRDNSEAQPQIGGG